MFDEFLAKKTTKHIDFLGQWVAPVRSHKESEQKTLAGAMASKGETVGGKSGA